MFFRGPLLLFISVVLFGCSQPEPTIEEEVLMGMFANFVAAEAYDRICNGGKIAGISPTKDLNIYWHGNQQTLVALIAAPMKRRHPGDSVEDAVRRLKKIQNKIATKSQSILSEKGCDSAKASHMKKILEMFVKIPPWGLSSMVAEQVKKKGGTMTELTAEENRLFTPETAAP